ncbi:unnamed protein product, partial [Polarella glacialis]
KSKGGGQGYTRTWAPRNDNNNNSPGSASSTPSSSPAKDKASSPVAAPMEIPGIPWPLLPCELSLVESLRALAEAVSVDEREKAVLCVLRAHPFIEVKGRPGGGVGDVNFGNEALGSAQEEHFRLNLGAFRRWLKDDEGRPFARGAGGPSDDGLYTLSAVLRRCMPRGLSLFTFAAASETGQDGKAVVVRGFRKFTGLTATDEDEESAATDRCDDFYFAPKASAEFFAVTTKSNGENGKFTVRTVRGEPVLFAGSKNTCLAWHANADVTELHPPGADPTIPGPMIAEKMQRFWRAWDSKMRQAFLERVDGNGWTLMLEHNSAHHEHVFPIKEDFVEFVAVLDLEGLPVAQKEAFAFFDEFGLPRVQCEAGLAMDLLPSRLEVERAATDKEGAVLYLEDARGAPVALVKVKSDFYVKARRTRQMFWNTIVDPLLRGAYSDKKTPDSGKSDPDWGGAEKRLRQGMKELQHVGGCDMHWQEWAEVAVGFIRWFKAEFDALDEVKRKVLVLKARDKFGTVYRDYCRQANLPGGDN